METTLYKTTSVTREKDGAYVNEEKIFVRKYKLVRNSLVIREGELNGILKKILTRQYAHDLGAKTACTRYISKAKNEGYSIHLPELGNVSITIEGKRMLPALAHVFQEHYNKIDYSSGEVYQSPKLDGMRGLLFVKDKKAYMLSREGVNIMKKYRSIPHIIHEACSLPDGIYDGELYADGYLFQEIMEMVKKPCKDNAKVKFYIYDFVSTKPYKERIKKIDIPEINKALTLVYLPSVKIDRAIQIQKVHQEFVSLNYEGSVIRHGDRGYQIDARTTDLLKFKDVQDLAAKVIDITPASTNTTHGVLVCEFQNQVFRVNINFGGFAARQRLLTHKEEYLGKTAEIRFHGFTARGVPREAKCVGFRVDK